MIKCLQTEHHGVCNKFSSGSIIPTYPEREQRKRKREEANMEKVLRIGKSKGRLYGLHCIVL